MSATTPTTRPWSQLPRDAKLLLVGVGIDALGAGLALPFLVVYLAKVRGIPYETVGLIVAVPAVVALCLLAPLGSLIDRIGPRRVQVGALSAQICGVLLLSQAETATVAFAANALIGVGHAAFWPANQSLVAAIVPSELRQRYFGISFTLLNAGIGIGGLIGAAFVDTSRPSTFETLYVLDALSFLAPLLLLVGPLRHIGNRVVHETAAAAKEAASGSYREVLSDRVFRRLLVVVFFSAFVGYGQLEAGWTAYAVEMAEASTRTIGIAFAVNTGTIVVLQLVVLRFIEGRRRTRVFAALAAIWALSWGIMGAAGLAPATFGSAALLVLSMGVFALGETLLSPVAPALTNDLAPDRLRGRYNAVASLAFQAAAITAPASAGFLIGRDLGGVYVSLLVTCCVAFGWLSLRLERWLPAKANGVTEDAPAMRLEDAPAQA